MSDPSCLLFFPGSRPEMLPKAIASGADLVCVDLEDAVAPEAKASSRAAVTELLEAPDRSPRLIVRINHPDTADGEADVRALVGLALRDDLRVMVPKVDAPEELSRLRERLAGRHEGVALIPVVETARGLSRVEEIAAVDAVASLIVGGLDLSVDLGCALDWEALLYARSRCVHAARLGGVGLLDTPYFDVDDPEGLRSEAERAHRLGFTGKAAIHPSQVETIREVFRPSDDEVDRARRVVEAVERGARGAFLVDGVMIDRPAIQSARRIVQRHGARAHDA